MTADQKLGWAISAGVPWRSDASDEAGCKAMQREFEPVTVDGLVKTYRPKRVKTLGVNLTERGEPRRGRCAGCRERGSIHRRRDATGHLLGCAERAINWDGRIWIPETLLAGVGWDQCAGDEEARAKLVAVEDTLLSAMNRRRIISNAIIRRHVWYSSQVADHHCPRGSRG